MNLFLRPQHARLRPCQFSLKTCHTRCSLRCITWTTGGRHVTGIRKEPVASRLLTRTPPKPVQSPQCAGAYLCRRASNHLCICLGTYRRDLLTSILLKVSTNGTDIDIDLVAADVPKDICVLEPFTQLTHRLPLNHVHPQPLPCFTPLQSLPGFGKQLSAKACLCRSTAVCSGLYPLR
jgi:hypothetical protein